MGQQQSKDELLYQQVNYGNVEGIRSLKQDGAGLEWIDKDGKTPLIVACMTPELYNVAKVLIELGANVNAYRHGGYMGTPLHHAAKRGLDQTVVLLLSHGANPLVMNDDCQTPLDIARVKGYSKVVRAIESHVCFFRGWVRELYGPSILEAFAPNWLSRKIWVVIVPCTSHNRVGPLKLELAIYTNLQDARPRATILLWKAKFEGPKFHLADPSLVILDTATKTRYRLTSAVEGDKEQLQQLCNSIRGVPQVITPPAPPSVPVEDAEFTMAINTSMQSATVESSRPPLVPASTNSNVTCASGANGWENVSDNSSCSGWGAVGETTPPSGSSTSLSHNGWGAGVESAPPSKASSSGWLNEPTEDPIGGWGVGTESTDLSQINIPSKIPATSIPSAPPIPEDAFDGPIHYPSIDSGPVDINMSVSAKNDKAGSSSSCVVCLDAPAEGACIPCGHMVGCMSCLNQITTKKWGCPLCRANIDQVVRVYVP